MQKQISFLIALVLLLTLTSTTLAQGPVLPHDSDPTWQASYWNNTALSGSPVLQREETNLNYDWGSGSPHSSVNADGFSARWTRYLHLSEGDYRFTTTSDDGIRIWVDGDLIINEWYDHSVKTISAEKYLATGHHWVVVEFYENQGEAVAKLSWEATVTPVQNWQGEYFNNTTLSGTPALVRDDAEINFDWGSLSPDTDVINADSFSARWTRTVNLPAGNYRFAMTVDDGGRLWVNDHLLIESWQDQPAQTYTEDIYLPGGDVPLKMEYYENGGKAVAKLSWELLSPDIQGWRGEYWNNMTFSGTPTLTRDDAQVDFNWGLGSPASGVISADQFSARWTRTPDFAAGRYRFTMTADDGVRLWVNNSLLIDAWWDQAAQSYAGEIDLPGGAVPIKVEYYEHGGNAVAQLSWEAVGTTPAPGTVVIDDTDAGFVRGGSSTGWRTVAEGYGGHLTWTWNNDYERPYYNWARWYPSLAPGSYEVLVFVPERYTTTSQAYYRVSHADGDTLRTVNQATNGNRWVSLGTYRFDGSDDEYVLLTDATNETRLTRLIAFDAVKWVPR